MSSIPVFDFQKAILTAMHAAYTGKERTLRYSLEFYISLIFHHLVCSPSLQSEVALVSDKTAPFARYCNYRAAGLAAPNFSFQSLVESVRADHLVNIVKLLLLEKKVLLVRDSCSENAVIIEAILTLMFPLYVCGYM